MSLLTLLMLIVMMLAACGGDGQTGPTPLSTELEVRLSFMMTKDAWYDCGIAVQGDHSREIKIFVNDRHEGSIVGTVPHRDEHLDLIVKPGRYDWHALGENYQHERLRWSGTVLANYPRGATIRLVCGQ